MVDLCHEPPAAEDYVRLRRESGLTARTAEEALPALQNSWAWVHARVDGQVVAMGRVIGDGGWYFHIADMATSPGYQRRGIGRAVLRALLERIHRAAPGTPWVTLFADAPGVPLYRSMGFVSSGCQGMELVRPESAMMDPWMPPT
ncbi:MAG: GNAT family N-acetyltransferase [Candidatus Nanopelagicales bacterium]